jgi:uncharacterized membrane protein
MNRSLATAAGLGAVTGMRSMQALAWVSRDLSRRLPRKANRLERWLAAHPVSLGLSAFALGELVADKLPVAPDRVRPGPLLGRAVLGACVGAVAAPRGRELAGAAVGATAATAAAAAAWYLRREAQRATRLPDPVFGMVEDAVAAALARELVNGRRPKRWPASWLGER